MLSRRNRSRKSRRRSIVLLLMVIVFIFLAGPFVWRVEQLRQAKAAYDVQKVEDELQWFDQNAGLLSKLEILKDTKLWLELNIGGEDLESKLVSYQDEKHQFWLYILYLQEGELIKGQKVLNTMSESSLKLLGEGLMSMAKGDAQQSRHLLTETTGNWKTLSNQEQTIRHLTLAQAALIMGDHQATQTELATAQQLDPRNPACLSMAFDVAIELGQWTKAIEVSEQIDDQTWRPTNTLYETKKAILAIQEQNIGLLTDSLASLQELPQSEAYINYVNGIEAIGKGQLKDGKDRLEQALGIGLEGALKADAQKALSQIIDRQKADQDLRAVVAESA